MGGSITEKRSASGSHLNRFSLSLGWPTTDVVIAERVSLVFVGDAMAAGDQTQRTIVCRCIIDGQPHRRALQRVPDLEVGVVLVPARTGAVAARFEKQLVKVEEEGIADQSRDNSDHAVIKRQSSNEIGLIVEWDQLQIGLLPGKCLPVTLGAHIAHQPLSLKSQDLMSKCLYFIRPEQVPDHAITLLVESLNVSAAYHGVRVAVLKRWRGLE